MLVPDSAIGHDNTNNQGMPEAGAAIAPISLATMTAIPDSLPTERDALLGKPKKGVDTAFLIVSMIAVFVATCDESFVLSTSREVAAELGQSEYGAWLAAGYNLGYMVALPTYGKFCDIYGRKLTLLVSYSTFAIGCTLTGTARSIYMAIAGRIIAGAGGSGMIDLTSVLLNDMTTSGNIAVLRSYLALVTSLGVSSGAPVGSMLMSTIGWRWSFLSHVPIVLACFAAIALKLPADLPRGIPTADLKDGQESHEKPDFDAPGIVFLSVTMALLVLLLDFPVDLGDAKHQVTALLVLLFVVFGFAFVIRELYWASDPLILLSLLRTRQFVYICLGQLVMMIADSAILSNLANYYIRSGAVDVVTAGYYVVPLCLGGAISAVVSGLIIKKSGRYKLLSVYSVALGLVSCFMVLIRFGSHPDEWEMIYSFFFGVGLGGALSSQFTALSLTTREHSSTAITMYYLFQQVGMIVGTSMAASLLRTDFTARLRRHLGHMPDSHILIDNILADSHFTASLPPALQAKVWHIFRVSFHLVPGLAVSALTLAIPLVALQDEKCVN